MINRISNLKFWKRMTYTVYGMHSCIGYSYTAVLVRLNLNHCHCPPAPLFFPNT